MVKTQHAWEVNTFGNPIAYVDTPYGAVRIEFFDGDRATVLPKSDAPDTIDALTFRGKFYSGRVSVNGLSGNTCEWRERSGSGVCGKVGMHDHGRDYARVDAPPSYAAKMVAAMHDAVRTFVAANPDVLIAAQRHSLESELATAERKVIDAQKDVLNARNVRDGILTQLANLGGI